MTAGRTNHTMFASEPVHISGICDMGVGCYEYSKCYAEAHGKPDRCAWRQTRTPIRLLKLLKPLKKTGEPEDPPVQP